MERLFPPDTPSPADRTASMATESMEPHTSPTDSMEPLTSQMEPTELDKPTESDAPTELTDTLTSPTESTDTADISAATPPLPDQQQPATTRNNKKTATIKMASVLENGKTMGELPLNYVSALRAKQQGKLRRSSRDLFELEGS